MTYSKKGKVIQMLSPENYIRQRARSLPLLECLVNSDWEDSQMVNVIIAREHSNSNVTVCLYLVDLFSQGVKDTTWFFNIPEFEYDDLKEEINEKMELEEVRYEIAHNIIFAATEFAEEYGFLPHRDFTSVTRYMLEEDSDKIELLDIKCGIDGKPAYMRTPNHSKSEADRIIATLEKNAGPGNYIIFDEADEDTGESDEEEDPHNLRGMTFAERKKLFLQLSERLESLSDDETAQYSDLSDLLFDELCDNDEVERYYNRIKDELKIPILPYNKVPDELLGIINETQVYLPELKALFLKIYETLHRSPKKARKKIKEFRTKARDLPAVDFLELKLLQKNGSNEYAAKLKEYAGRHPDYTMIKLLEDSEKTPVEIKEIFSGQKTGIETYFRGRTSLHSIEMYNYLEFRITALADEKNPNRIQAFIKTLLEYRNLPEIYKMILLHMLAFMKLKFITEYLAD